jgi:hypothetical protein
MVKWLTDEIALPQLFTDAVWAPHDSCAEQYLMLNTPPGACRFSFVFSLLNKILKLSYIVVEPNPFNLFYRP